MLHVHKEINVSISTIARYLEGRLYTMKKLESIPINRNTIEIKEARPDHAFWLQSQHESGGRFCYVDETGFGLYTARTRGRAVKGLPARKIVCNQRTPHITILCTICPNIGMIHHKIMSRCKTGRFRPLYFRTVCPRFRSSNRASWWSWKAFHYYGQCTMSSRCWNQVGREHTKQLEFDTSSSIQLWVKSFNSVKASIKRALSINGPIIPTEGQTLVAARRHLLIAVCPESLSQITPAVTLNSFFHVLTCTASKAIRMVDL